MALPILSDITFNNPDSQTGIYFSTDTHVKYTGASSGDLVLGAEDQVNIRSSSPGSDTLIASFSDTISLQKNTQIQGLLGVGLVPNSAVQLSVNGQIGASNNGNAGAPDFTFYGDDNTGMYRAAANNLGFSTNGTAALTLDELQNASFAADVDVEGRLDFMRTGFTAISSASSTFTINFASTGNNFQITLDNAANTIAFSNLSSSVIGRHGNIIITNPSSVGSLSVGNLPSTAYSPGGATINWDTNASSVSILSYFILASDKVLINYVGNFKSYGT